MFHCHGLPEFASGLPLGGGHDTNSSRPCTLIHDLLCRIPCRLFIHELFFGPLGLHLLVWSELGRSPPFRPMRALTFPVVQEVVFGNNPSDHETWSIWCRVGIHIDSTSILHSYTLLVPQAQCGANLEQLHLFHQWECLKCNGHGLSVSCVKWPLTTKNIVFSNQIPYVNNKPPPLCVLVHVRAYNVHVISWPWSSWQLNPLAPMTWMSPTTFTQNSGYKHLKMPFFHKHSHPTPRLSPT